MPCYHGYTSVWYQHNKYLRTNKSCIVQAAIAAIGATYSSGAGVLNGTVTYKGVAISLDSTAGQLWATEMASLYQAAVDAAQEHHRRCRLLWLCSPLA